MTEEEKIVEELLSDHPIQDMVRFSDLDITQKLEENSFMIVRYKEMYYKELATFENLETKYEKLIGLRYKYYRFEADQAWTKPEIEKYCIPSDPKVLQMKGILARQKVKVRFFETCYKAFERMQWNMKSFIDVMKSGY